MTVGWYLESTNNGYSLEQIYSICHLDDWKYWLEEMVDTLKETTNFIPSENEINLVTADYTESEIGSYEFNDVLSKTRIYNLEDFLNFWNEKLNVIIEEIKKEKNL